MEAILPWTGIMKRGIVLEGLCASWISRGGITSVSLKAVRRSARRCDEFYPVRKSGYAGTRGQTGNVGKEIYGAGEYLWMYLMFEALGRSLTAS